jgi:OOP family OmpA-OmpF porin
MKIRIRWRAAIALVMLSSAAAAAGIAAAAPPAWGPDAKGGQDHPLVSRFSGSWLIGYRATDWDQVRFPIGAEVDSNRQWKQTVTVEGKITRLFYLAPQGKSRLEVHRNYEQALLQAGFQRKFACESKCDALYFAMADATGYRESVRWAEGSVMHADGGSRYSFTSAMSPHEGRLWYGTLSRGGEQVHLLMYTAMAANHTTDKAVTYLQIAEPKPMPSGQVAVDAKALQGGLQAEGKVALYGIYFDTGKAQVKPESKPQLDEMAKLLQSQPALKVYIVGHTDNQGSLDGNLALSMQRAQAISQALSAQYKIDSARLQARGVASLAPVASNGAEEGRARNRRVELVVQ